MDRFCLKKHILNAIDGFFVSAARTGKLPSCSHATSDGKKNLPAVLDGAKNSSVLPWKTLGTQEPTWKRMNFLKVAFVSLFDAVRSMFS
jgi:hypothetical protein